ncbi:Uncharacterized protein APZ42_012754 [Daphnia magna]|uniref:Uncharacterized protein n=1 Tax=Daphnia magna TaxID=35525 RepID=A0A162RI76_9CRUS|nr:Uncharacterized protein APZ42_012754 [Daphnia magna]
MCRVCKTSGSWLRAWLDSKNKITMLVPHRLGGRGGPCVWSVGWKSYFGTDILLYLTSTTLLETSSVLSGENILRNFVIQICRNFYYMQVNRSVPWE